MRDERFLRRTGRGLRLGALLVSVTVFVPLFVGPARAGQTEGSCSLVGVELVRKPGGSYALQTTNSGMCVVSDTDPVADMASVTGVTIRSTSVSRNDIGCGAGNSVATVRATVSVSFLSRTGTPVAYVDGVHLVLQAPGVTAATEPAALALALPMVGTGTFLRGAGGACSAPAPGSGETVIASWSLGTFEFAYSGSTRPA